MVLNPQEIIVGTFADHDQAEQAVRRLIDAGVPPTHISILTQGIQGREQVHGYVHTGDIAEQGAKTGAWAGGIFGLLTGAAFFFTPAGPLFILGPLVNAALGAVEVGAIGGLIGAVLGRHMEKEHTLTYERSVRGGEMVVTVQGSSDEVATARRVLDDHSAQNVNQASALA